MSGFQDLGEFELFGGRRIVILACRCRQRVVDSGGAASEHLSKLLYRGQLPWCRTRRCTVSLRHGTGHGWRNALGLRPGCRSHLRFCGGLPWQSAQVLSSLKYVAGLSYWSWGKRGLELRFVGVKRWRRLANRSLVALGTDRRDYNLSIHEREVVRRVLLTYHKHFGISRTGDLSSTVTAGLPASSSIIGTVCCRPSGSVTSAFLWCNWLQRRICWCWCWKCRC